MDTDKTTQAVDPSEQEFRKTAPAPAEAPVIHIEDFKEFTLDNGLQVILVENHKRPTVSYSIRLDRDPVLEGNKTGYTSIAGQLLNTGTENRSKVEIDEEIDFIGGHLSTGSTGVYGQSLKKHSASLLDLMQDILLNPTFPEAEFDKLIRRTKSGIEADMNDPDAISSNITNMVVYGKDHPYGEFATVESIENITREDIINYYETYFKPNIAYLVIVGDITEKEAKEQAEKYFGSWEKGNVPSATYETPQAPDGRKVAFVNRDNAVQSLIKVTYPVQLQEGDENILAARVMNSVLGGGVFSGYLMQNLREDKAYTYGARSQLSSDEIVGVFTAYASVRNEVTDSSVVEFLREMNRIRTEPVSEEQLQLVKNNMTGSFSRSLERPETVAEQAYRIFKYDLPKDYYKTYLQRLDAVTAEDVQAAAQMFIKPDNAIISIVGNKDEVADDLAHFSSSGQIDFYDSKGNLVADEEKDPPVGYDAHKVFSNYIKALGGRLNVFPINSLLWESDIEMMGQTLHFVEMWSEPNKYRQATIMNDIVFQEVVYNNGEAKQTTMQGPVELSEDDIEKLSYEAHLFMENRHDQYANYERIGSEVELISIATVDGVEAYKIKITFPNGDVQYNYYSVDDNLKIMESSTAEGPDGTPMTVTKKFSDYKRVGELLYPHTMKIEGAAPQPMVFKTTNIEVNYDFEDKVFNIED